MTTIKIELSQRSIVKAKAEIMRYRQDLEQKVELLTQRLVDEGVELAKVNVAKLGSFDTGVLEGSITGYFSPSLGTGLIKTDCYYAIYVEFGTGIRGSEASHPLSGELGYDYDVNNHGEEGWFFYNQKTGKSGWTTGMPSRAFMYETVKELEMICGKIAKEVFKS
ncbi:hypothetical protein [Anaerosporobacter sp.]|uniref:hypothetical protein n=1 Tax=Anaerosporobacter sp. TaxID=1872529 RepID=UPI00286F1108|nr:hypothetical protein [Anaerosporobacter sp.]